MKRVDVRAVGRERTRAEKLRRRKFGDKGAKFSIGKRGVLLGGGNRLCNNYRNKRQPSGRDI